MPFWNISQRLTSLEILCDDILVEGGVYDRVSEQIEETFAAVETPAPKPFINSAAYASYHVAVICRTIIAAARGGRLRHLSCDDNAQYAFAIRALVPFWVHIQDWDGSEYLARGWLRAAASLRPLLAHVSLWGTSPSLDAAREDRSLTGEELQSLDSHFEQEELPRLYDYEKIKASGVRRVYDSERVVDFYLPGWPRTQSWRSKWPMLGTQSSGVEKPTCSHVIAEGAESTGGMPSSRVAIPSVRRPKRALVRRVEKNTRWKLAQKAKEWARWAESRSQKAVSKQVKVNHTRA